MTLWFTSDTHFYHKKIVEYCQRPVPGLEKSADFITQCPPGQIWTSNVEKMNEWLITRWNEKVKPDDEVWHLGDFFFCGRVKAVEILERLNGTIHWLLGNHDYGIASKLKLHALVACSKLFIEHSYKFLRIPLTYEGDEGIEQSYVQPIVLCHFPILSWDGMAHGSWHLHGHCHGSIDDTWNSTGLRMDVGVDAEDNNWYPVSVEQIQNRMALRTVTPVDHHKGSM